MIVTYKWLNDFVDLSDVSISEIVDKFINIGFEVESVCDLSKGMERVRVGRITKLTKHPNADKLQICSISLGDGERVQILTAATNVFEGALVPCALDGADLPNGVKINTTNMRGEISEGMLCSGEELQINDSIYPTASVDGIMILDNSAKEGQNIAEFLGLDDIVLDIKVLPNRPDCQCVAGLAKELSVGFDKKFVNFDQLKTGPGTNLPLEVEIKTDKCPVYFAGQVRDVSIEDSLDFIKRRLRTIGIKPKNSIVDMTNYLLWEIGQPLHAFDYDKIMGHKIIVREAREGESIVGVDNKTYNLTPGMLVVANETEPMAIAGVIGGRDYSISETTENIVIESAVFDRASIRRTARALGLRTDASARYERGVETISAYRGIYKALELACGFGIGRVCRDLIKAGEVNEHNRVILLSIAEIKATLGIEISTEIICSILKSLDIEVTPRDADVLVCSVPPIRADIMRSVDLIEEIIRIYGFSAIKPTYCENTQTIAGGMSYELSAEYDLLGFCLSSGAYQVRTYGFRSPVEFDKLLLAEDDKLRDCVKIQNPLSLDYSIMRTQMLSSLLSVAGFNESHKNTNIKICEIGKIFMNDRSGLGKIPLENKILGYLATGKTDFFALKALTELIASKLNTNFTYIPTKKSFMHPNICADIALGNRVIGFIGKVHPQVTSNFEMKSDAYYFELNLNMLPPKKFKKMKALPKFPAAYRDLAVLVDSAIPVGNMIQTIKKAGGNLLENVELFDIYEGSQIAANQKNVAFNLTFRKVENTLTQAEVNELFDKIVAELNKNFSAVLRA